MAKIRTDLDFNLLDNVTRGLGRIEKGVSGLGASITKVNQAAELTGRAISAIGNAVGAINDTVNASAELQLSLKQIAELAGSSAEEQEALYKAVQDAGDNFLTTSKEAQEALRLLAEDGFRGEEAISALNTVLAFAQSNAQGAAAAAANLGSILDQFQEPAEKIGSLADGLTAISRAADTSTTNVQQGLEGLGVAAEQANISIEDSLALIGLLATKGIEGSRGTKALSTAIQDLQNPASTAGRALHELGIAGDDFLAVLERLRTDSDAAEKVLAGLGNRPRAAIRALLEEGGKSLDEFREIITQSAGASAEAGKVIEDTYLFQVNRLQNAIAKLRDQAVGPILDPLANSAEQIADKLRELADTGAFDELGKKVAEFAEASSAKVLQFINAFDTDVAVQKVQGLIEALEVLGRTAGLAYDAAELVASGFKLIGESAGKGVAGLQLWIERQDAFKFAAGLGSQIVRQFGDDVEESGEKAAGSSGKLENLRRNVARAVEEFFRITGAARDAAVSVEDIEQASEPATRSIAKIKEELRAASQAGDDYNTTRLTKELGRAEEAFKGSASAAAEATEAYKKAEAALRDAIAGGDPAKIAQARQAFLEQKKLAEENEQAFRRLTETQERSSQAIQAGAQQAAQAQRDVGDAAQDAADTTQQASAQSQSAVQQLAARINALRAEFAAFGEVAANEFEKRLDRLNFGFRGLGTSMINYVTQLENAAGRVRIAIGVQEDAVKNLESGLSAAVVGVGRFGQSASETVARLEQLEASTRDTNGQFNLLNQQRLDKLRRQIQETTQAVREQADALAELNRLAAVGDDRQLAALDLQRQLDYIDEVARRAGQQGARTAEAARQAAVREHQRRLEEINERGQAERQTYDDTDALSQRNFERDQQRRQSSGGGLGGSRVPAPATPQQPASTVNNFTFEVKGTLVDKDTLVDELMPAIEKGLSRSQQLRR